MKTPVIFALSLLTSLLQNNLMNIIIPGHLNVNQFLCFLLDDNDESERFLPPVKLDPGWEGMDHSSEELNILERNLEQLKKEQPPDHWNLVYIIMILHGIGMLMPWNMFITAKSVSTKGS